MMKVLTTIVFLLVTVASYVHCKGQCVTRGQCEDDPVTGLKRPCVYNGPPVPLISDSEAIKTLQNLCPALDMGHVCCDADQVTAFQTNLATLATLFERCPSCYHNLATVFCQLVCSPSQSRFLKVTESTPFEDKQSVSKLNYYITETYAQGLFDSCANVQFGTAKAVSISCGSHGKDCTPHFWLQFMGGHDPSPYEMDFQFELNDTVVVNGTTFFPMNEAIVPCSQAVAGSVACSSIDCPSH